jgi:membrane protease YdiL (CAAX protease family)
MPYLNFSSAKPSLKFAITIMSIITIGLIVWFIGILIGRLIFWMHLDEVNNLLYGRLELMTIAQLKYFQFIQSLGFFLLPGVFLYWFFSAKDEAYFNVSQKPKLISILLLVLAILAAVPLINWLMEMNQSIKLPKVLSSLESSLKQLEENNTSITVRLLTSGNLMQYFFNIIVIAIIPAIGEELIFRGVFQKLFMEIRRNVHFSVLITAFIFSLIHGQFYGIIPRFVLGLFLGYLMVWSKTIWLPIIAHFLNNLLVVTVYFLFEHKIIRKSPDIFDFGIDNIYIILFSVLVLGVIIPLIRRQEKLRAQLI